MQLIKNQTLTKDRALFNSTALKITECVFETGESPLKESSNVILDQSVFKWKYPLWYCNKVDIDKCTLLETARSGIWYTRDIKVANSTIEAPKTFRRSSNIELANVNLPLAQETLWQCANIKLADVTVKGDYFACNSQDIEVSNLKLTGNYSFDGCVNVTIENSTLLSKDAFWNCENVTVKNSTIIGEYLGWNSKNLTFVDCSISSLQGLCYIENLKMVNCKMLDTNLAFEYSTVDVDIPGQILSIFNPRGGIIKTPLIGEVVLDPGKIDPSQLTLITNKQPSGSI